MEKQKVFIPVSGDLLPETSGYYNIISEDTDDGDHQDDMMYFDGEKWVSNYPQFKVSTWLKEYKGYFFTQEQMEQFIKDSRNSLINSVTKYIQSLTIK